MDHYIYRIQQGKRGTQAKPKTKVDWKMFSLQATLLSTLWLLMVRLAESLELWCTGRKFAGVISWTRPVLRVRFSKDSVKIVIESHYLFSNVNFYSEIFSLVLKDWDFAFCFLSQMRTSTPKKPASSSSHLPVVNSELFEVHPTSDHDSAEEDNDYYFSDE